MQETKASLVLHWEHSIPDILIVPLSYQIEPKPDFPLHINPNALIVWVFFNVQRPNAWVLDLADNWWKKRGSNKQKKKFKDFIY